MFVSVFVTLRMRTALEKAVKEMAVKYPEKERELHNRIKMLKQKKYRAYNNEWKKSFKKKILETEQKIIESKRNERLDKEKQCIESMKDNPKVFYSFINKQRNRRVEVGPFKKR